MTFNLSTGRKALSALAVAAVLGVALSPASAFAKDNHHGHRGFGAAAFAGGLVLGAIAAAVADDRDEPRCWTEKRVRFDAFGDKIVQRVRVCG